MCPCPCASDRRKEACNCRRVFLFTTTLRFAENAADEVALLIHRHWETPRAGRSLQSDIRTAEGNCCGNRVLLPKFSQKALLLARKTAFEKTGRKFSAVKTLEQMCSTPV